MSSPAGISSGARKMGFPAIKILWGLWGQEEKMALMVEEFLALRVLVGKNVRREK